MSEDEYVSMIEARMGSGEPFTYGMLCQITPRPPGSNGRTADKLIQRWRRQGRVEMKGRLGRAPRWVLIPPAAS